MEKVIKNIDVQKSINKDVYQFIFFVNAFQSSYNRLMNKIYKINNL